MLEIKNISFQFSEKKVLDGISHTFEKGRVVGILGKNGAGKTTLFRNIMGWYKPSFGEILYNEKPIEKQDISFLETAPYFYPYMKGREYLQLIQSKEQEKAIRYAEILNVPLNMLVENYSTGMKKKLAFIGALLQNRSILILDEPFNGVDLESNEILKQVIEKEKKDRIILLSSHIFSTLLENCDEMIFLQKGKVGGTFQKDNFVALEELIKKGIEVQIDGLNEI